MNPQNTLLKSSLSYGKIDEAETVTLSRKELKYIHDQSMALVQLTRRLMGMQPIITGKQRREAAREAQR